MYRATFKFVKLSPIYKSLGDLLTILITIDYIIDENECIKSAWTEYKRMMQLVRIVACGTDHNFQPKFVNDIIFFFCNFCNFN